MSGPKIIDYRAVERERAEAARRRWRSLEGRASALRRRCAVAEHPECAVEVGVLSGDSDAMQRQCDDLEQAISQAVAELAGRELADRTRQVTAGMKDVLAELERRERAAATRARERADQAARQHESAPQVDYVGKVNAKLASLRVASPEIDGAAREVLAAGDPARARLLYADLAERIEEINDRAERAEAQRTQIAELRAQLPALPDPEPVGVLLDQADAEAERQHDVQALLAQARDAVTEQLDTVAAQNDRVFVRQVVADSLAELGYQVLDVDVQTPETLVLRQSGTHGLRADIGDGAIDLRAVRLGTSDPVADRDAEEEFCRRMPDFLSAMSRRGVSAGITEQKLPGLFTPETISLRRKETRSTSQQDQQESLTRKRGAR